MATPQSAYHIRPQDIKKEIGRFRILVVGRANAGKTTLLQRVCDTNKNPKIFDGEGNKIDAAIVKSSINRERYDIKNEVVFESNQGFVFHESCGFEAGGEDEFRMMKEFISERTSTLKLKERIHAIWYCIPMDEHHLPITKAEERFFSECDTSGIPVITVFTKFDVLWDEACAQLRESGLGLTGAECNRRAPDHAKEIFAKAKTWDRLCETQYPPKDHICLADMQKDNADCGPLLQCTTSALGEEVMQMLLLSTQQTNLSLCVKYAVASTLMLYTRRAHTSTGISWRLSKDTHIEMQEIIAAWFPHTKLTTEEFFTTARFTTAERLERTFLRRTTARTLVLEDAELVLDAEAALLEGGFELKQELELLKFLKFPDDLLANIQFDNSLARESASLTSPQICPSHSLTETLQFGIALIIILEHSFFLLPKCTQFSENIFKLAATEYRISQTQAAVEEAVKEVLHHYDGDDDKLGEMVIDIILRYRISKVPLAKGRK